MLLFQIKAILINNQRDQNNASACSSVSVPRTEVTVRRVQRDSIEPHNLPLVSFTGLACHIR